eukprot:381147-Pyramimonas_sp.AAC.1
MLTHALFNPLYELGSVSASSRCVHESFAVPGHELRDEAKVRISSMTAWQPNCVSKRISEPRMD